MSQQPSAAFVAASRIGIIVDWLWFIYMYDGLHNIIKTLIKPQAALQLPLWSIPVCCQQLLKQWLVEISSGVPIAYMLSTFHHLFVVYNAVGLAAYDIYDDVDFDSWLSNKLVNELKISHSK